MAATVRSTVRLAERPLIGRLREQLRAAEAAMGLGDPAHPLALGIPEIDSVLSGGLVRGTLHEIAAAREADTAAATGFALALAAGGDRTPPHRKYHCATASPEPRSSLLRPLPPWERAALTRPHIQMGEGAEPSGRPAPSPILCVEPLRLPSPTGGEGTATTASSLGCNVPDPRATAVVWIADDLSLAEHGAPYGPGLEAAGVAPERLITIAAARSCDVLWAMEEALRCRAIGLVIGELRAREIDPVATRRLSLAAAAGTTLGILLRPAPGEETSAAATRWIVGTAPSASLLPTPERGGERWDGAGPPRLITQLTRNRRGHLGTWIVEWNRTEQRYVLASANPQPLALPPLDRSHPAAVA